MVARRRNGGRTFWVLTGLVGCALGLSLCRLGSSPDPARELQHPPAAPRHRALRAPPPSLPEAQPPSSTSSLHGIVRARSGAPLRDATVCPRAASDALASPETSCIGSDEAGRFTLERRGIVALLVSAPGYQPRLLQPLDPAAQQLEIVLDPGGRIASGRVLDGLGGPISGASVTARRDASQPIEAAALSGAQGEFSLGLAGTGAELCARAEGYSQACSWVTAPSEGNELALLPASSISGRVLMDRGREPVVGAVVIAISHSSAQVSRRTTVSDEAGEFTFGELTAGVYEISAVSETARAGEESIPLGVAESLESVLLLAQPAVPVTGEVLVSDARCGSGWVRLLGPLRTEAPLSADGAVRIAGVLPGRYTAIASCSGAIADTSTIEILAEPVHHVWTLRPLPPASASAAAEEQGIATGTLLARVRAPGERGGVVQVFAESRQGLSERGRRVGGQFVFDELPLGEYRIYADDAVEQAQAARLTRAGETVRVDLDPAPSRAIHGTVLDQQNLPVADAWVRAFRADLPSARFTAPLLSDANGRFTFRGVENARYTLSVSSPAGEALVREVSAGKEEIVVRVAQAEPD